MDNSCISLVIDTETTGLPDVRLSAYDQRQARIVQIAAILIDGDGNELEILDSLIKPDGWSLDDEEDYAHSWTHDDCMFIGQNAQDVLLQLDTMAKKSDVVVAHHAVFDLTMLRIESEYHSVALSILEKPYICTMLGAAPVCKLKGPIPGKWKYPSLEEAYLHVLGKEINETQQHEALYDARACKEVFIKLLKDGMLYKNTN